MADPRPEAFEDRRRAIVLACVCEQALERLDGTAALRFEIRAIE